MRGRVRVMRNCGQEGGVLGDGNPLGHMNRHGKFKDKLKVGENFSSISEVFRKLMRHTGTFV